MNPKVDAFLSKAKKWQEELSKLRMISLECGLIEELKWNQPCYSVDNKNIVILGGFKDYCALMFFKGTLLNDAKGILVKAGENSQSGRQIRFTNVQKIISMEALLKTYIYEAIEVEKAGLKVDFIKNSDREITEELQQKLDENPDLKSAYNALTPGRQRAYNLYFSAAKQSKTREARVEKYIQRILDGKGINDCICGLSRKPPTCDGSHKYI